MEQRNAMAGIGSKDLQDKLFEYGDIKFFNTGDVILDESSNIRAIPIVLTGMLKVIRTEEDGREILLYFIKPGESCIMSFLGGMHQETSKVRAEADDETEVLFIPVEKMSYFMQEFPQWLDYIFRLYHKRFEELLDVVNSIAFKKTDERLLDLLHKKAANAGSNIIQVTHEQLANELASVRVVISRLLKQLEDNGVVKLGRNKITLL